jgi:hypothetical protein
VLEAIKVALDEAGIDMPFETQVMLVHDQTEEIDGSRGKQREGWPKRRDGVQPRSAREAPKERGAPSGAEADRAWPRPGSGSSARSRAASYSTPASSRRSPSPTSLVAEVPLHRERGPRTPRRGVRDWVQSRNIAAESSAIAMYSITIASSPSRIRVSVPICRASARSAANSVAS